MTQTERAIRAFVAALRDQASQPNAMLPQPLRNEALPTRLFEGRHELQTYLNVWDGDGRVIDEVLGADTDTMEDGYTIEHRLIVELVIAGGEDDRREEMFDVCLEAIHDAIRRAGDAGYLSGQVDGAVIESITRSGGKGLVTDGLPNTKAAEITVVLTFKSSRPF